MKRKIYILGIILALGCSACNDWLTVQPESKIVAENLFTTDEGVKQALNGTYLILRGELYSPDQYMGGAKLVEAISCTWSVSSGTDEYDLADHVYDQREGVKSQLNSCFQSLYKVIANLNPLIEGLEINRAKLDSTVYRMVKGEALAIRACVHLDLIRLWGPMPSKIDASKEYLPYVTVNSTGEYTYIPFAKYMDLLLTDLNEAERLLKEVDPIITSTPDGTADQYSTWSRRKSRFNYYGVLGLQARARLWMGDTDNALKYARMVKEAVNEDGTPKFRLMNEADDFPIKENGLNSWTDGSCYSEHLCGVNVENFDYAKGVWQPSKASAFFYTPNYSMFIQQVFSGNSKDIRYRFLWVWEKTLAGMNANVSRKWRGFYPTTESKENFPIMRLSEIYFYIIENGTLTEANEAYQEFCEARGITYVPLTESDRLAKVQLEYIREFMGEGQNFFTYKRMAVTRMLWNGTSDCDEAQYVLPLPEKELKN